MPKVKKSHRRFGLLKILASPLILLFPIAVFSLLYGEGMDTSAYPAESLIGVSTLFIVLFIAYMVACARDEPKTILGVSGITCGLLIAFFARFMQVGQVFGYLGFLTLISGILLLMEQVSKPVESIFPRQIDSILPKNIPIKALQMILDAIDFPCAILEREENQQERIMTCNESFVSVVQAANPGKVKIAGSNLQAILPPGPDMDMMNLGGKLWKVSRKSKGKQILMMLTPPVQPSEPPRIEVLDSIDWETGLYTSDFMKYRARSDIEFVNRGKRKLSVAIFRLLPNHFLPIEMTQSDKEACLAVFGKIVVENVRACDSAYKIDEDVLLLMPDTSMEGAEKAINRIYYMMKKTGSIECPMLSHSIMAHAQKEFIGGVNTPTCDALLDEMTSLLKAQKYDKT